MTLTTNKVLKINIAYRTNLIGIELYKRVDMDLFASSNVLDEEIDARFDPVFRDLSDDDLGGDGMDCLVETSAAKERTVCKISDSRVASIWARRDIVVLVERSIECSSCKRADCWRASDAPFSISAQVRVVWVDCISSE